MGVLDDAPGMVIRYPVVKDGEQRMTLSAQKDQVSVMLMVRPGSLRNGLLALLKSIPDITRIEAPDDLASCLEWLKERQPHIAIIEGNGLGDDIRRMLLYAKNKSPTTCFVLFEEKFPDPLGLVDIQVEAVVLQGTQPDELVKLIESLIRESHERRDAK
jgi:DNA-binding NarL/FixJ family response regulator